MSTKKVVVERRIQQVQDGFKYQGEVKIGSTQLGYELNFTHSISQWDHMEMPMEIDEVRRLFQITIKREEVMVELTNDEYGFFFRLLVDYAVKFYNLDQTRHQNDDSDLAPLLHGHGPIARLGVKMAISHSDSVTCDLPIALCAMLSAPKFGCALAT